MVSRGHGTKFTHAETDDPADVPEVLKAMAARGTHVISMNVNGWSLEHVRAIATPGKAYGMITSVHIRRAPPQS